MPRSAPSERASTDTMRVDATERTVLMRIRAVLIGAPAIAVLALATGCSGGSAASSAGSSGANSSAPTQSRANVCHQLASASKQLNGLSGDMQNPSQLGGELQPVIAAFRNLRANAPARVSSSVHELLGTLQTAEKAATSGKNMNVLEQKMSNLLPMLSHDATVIQEYVKRKCPKG
jgi:hypothetical protein